MKDYFEYEESYELTINRSGSGVVLLDGKVIDTFPFTIELFKGVPVELTAVSMNGSRFSSWSNGTTEKVLLKDFYDEREIGVNFN